MGKRDVNLFKVRTYAKKLGKEHRLFIVMKNYGKKCAEISFEIYPHHSAEKQS